MNESAHDILIFHTHNFGDKESLKAVGVFAVCTQFYV